MGKYASTRGSITYHKKSEKPGSDLTHNGFSEWLYGEWSEEKLRRYELLHVIPGVSQYMDYLLAVRRDNEYLSRYGMDYSDIHDPSKLHQASAGSRFYGSLLNVSENIAMLYR